MSNNLLWVVLLAWPLLATTYTVKSAGGGDYTTIQACANVAVAGDTCTVFAGTYAEVVTLPSSGSSGSPITFNVNSGDTVVVSRFNVTTRSYIVIDGFEINSTTQRGIEGSTATNVTIQNNYIHSNGGGCVVFGLSSPASDITVRNNTIYHCGWGNGGSGATGITINGDRSLIENNDISHSADFMNAGGTNIVIRNNVCHDADNDELPGSSEHIDCIQVTGQTFAYSLVEGNIERNCLDSTGNCHFILVRNQAAAPADSIIFRYNYGYNIQNGGFGFGGTNDEVPNLHAYNNTAAWETNVNTSGACIAAVAGATDAVILNNICYNTTLAPWSPIYNPSVQDFNLVYQYGYAGAWNSPYSTESTYNALKNVDPLFSNYPTTGALRYSSPARGTGRYLTQVATSDSGSGAALVLDDARFFQDGYGIPTVQADWIRVGSTATAQISSIDYATNTITLVSGISRNDGDPVYLYKNSSGTIVLLDGQEPDIGAFPYIPAGSRSSGPITRSGPITTK